MKVPDRYSAVFRRGTEEVSFPISKDSLIEYCISIPEGVGERNGPFLPTSTELSSGFSCGVFDITARFDPVSDCEEEVEI